MTGRFWYVIVERESLLQLGASRLSSAWIADSVNAPVCLHCIFHKEHCGYSLQIIGGSTRVTFLNTVRFAPIDCAHKVSRYFRGGKMIVHKDLSLSRTLNTAQYQAHCIAGRLKMCDYDNIIHTMLQIFGHWRRACHLFDAERAVARTSVGGYMRLDDMGTH